MNASTTARIARAAFRTAIVGLATAAVGGGFIATANATAPTGARQLDWSNATLTLADLGARCPAGPVTFHDGTAQLDTGAVRPSDFFQGDVKFGDVNRDGRQDAVLSVTCWPNGSSTAALTATYAYGVKDGAPMLIGAVTIPPVTPVSYAVRGGTVAVSARPDRDATSAPVELRLRWDGKKFQERSGKAAYVYGWGTEPLALPFKGASAAMEGANGPLRPCPRITADFDNHGSNYDRNGEFVSADNFVYSIGAGSFGDVNGDGVTDAVVGLRCVESDSWEPNMWTFVYTIKDGKPVPLSYLTGEGFPARYTPITDLTMTPGKVTIKQQAGSDSAPIERTFRWTGHGLKALQPLPGFPKVDVAP